MDAPNQASRVRVRLVATVHGVVRDEVMLVPAHQTVAWVVNRSGWLVADEALRAAAVTRAGKVVQGDEGVRSGDVLVLALLCPATPRLRRV
jgi:hypothetical protein